jgi:hypothetical protein
MTRYLSALAIAALVAAGACSRGSGSRADSALNTDLSLAAQQQAPLDSISAIERGNALNTNPAATPAPVTRTSSGEVAHTSSTRRSSSSSTRRASSSGSRSSSSSGSSTVASQPRTVTEKHTKRDAAIGAAAGAVIGATTSKNKVKGGLIGAAVGGILGGVIGNNVDKKKKTVP